MAVGSIKDETLCLFTDDFDVSVKRMSDRLFMCLFLRISKKYRTRKRAKLCGGMNGWREDGE